MAGAKNWWAQETTGAREGHTRASFARPFQAPATQAIKVWRAIPDFMKVFLTVLISLRKNLGWIYLRHTRVAVAFDHKFFFLALYKKKSNGRVSRFYVYIHHDPAVVSVTVATRSIEY